MYVCTHCMIDAKIIVQKGTFLQRGTFIIHSDKMP